MNNTDTKVCKYCASDIPVKADFCPKCQKDLRNWFVKHYIITILLVLMGIGWIGSYQTEQIVQQNTIKQDELEKQKEISKILNPDGSNKVLTSMIKEIMNQPESYVHIKTTYNEQPGYFIFHTIYTDNGIQKNIKAKFDKENNFIEFID